MNGGLSLIFGEGEGSRPVFLVCGSKRKGKKSKVGMTLSLAHILFAFILD